MDSQLLGAAIQDDHANLYRLQGALLADDMGLGKTYMSLVTVGEYPEKHNKAANKVTKNRFW